MVSNLFYALIVFILVLFSFFLLLLSSWEVRDSYYQKKYEWNIPNEPDVTNTAKIDSILSPYPKLKYHQLPDFYCFESESHLEPFCQMLENSTYRIIPAHDIYKKIVGHHRIKDFMPKDYFYTKHFWNIDSNELIWLVNDTLLYRFIELNSLLDSLGYDVEQISIRNGYRPPKYNRIKEGAPKSRHIVGEAVDISVGDIDINGIADSIDKKVPYDLLDTLIIGDKGGLGWYSGSQTLHFDVRGKRARW
jgi:hypothetical protein